MAGKYIAMLAGRCPDMDMAPVFSFPAGKYGTDSLCSLFLSECRKRILAEQRQAIDVQLDLCRGTQETVLRCAARFGGMEKLEFELVETDNIAPMGRMPADLPRYRNLGSFGPDGWDIAEHGREYPSDPEIYAARLDKFFMGHARAAHGKL